MKLTRVRNALGRDARTIAISAAVASLVAATPAVAAYVANADKVDGKHAVGARAEVDERAGKLVATDGKGRLPNNILAKAMNADRLDGVDSSELRITTGGGTADTNPLLQGCMTSPVFAYPLTVTEHSQIFATAWAGLSVNTQDLLPSIRVELLDAEEDVVARSNPDTCSGDDGDGLGLGLGLGLGELILDDTGDAPYVAEPGSYTLRILGSNSGDCLISNYAQYQEARLTHLLIPAIQ